MANATRTRAARVSGAERDALVERVVRAYRAGDSVRKVSDDLGRSYGSVHKILVEAGVELRGRGGATRGPASSGPASRRTAARRAPRGKTPPSSGGSAPGTASAPEPVPQESTVTRQSPVTEPTDPPTQAGAPGVPQTGAAKGAAKGAKQSEAKKQDAKKRDAKKKDAKKKDAKKKDAGKKDAKKKDAGKKDAKKKGAGKKGG